MKGRKIMKYVVSNNTMRQADRNAIEAGTPAIELMYRAGCGIRDAFPFADHAPVAIFCGSGNNAGDGYVLALLLHEQNIPCTLILAEEKWSPEGRTYYDQCVQQGIPVVLWSPEFSLFTYVSEAEGAPICPVARYHALVDCLFGTGFQGTLPQPYAQIIHQMNGSCLPIISADIPSGLSGDSGQAALTEDGKALAVCATITVSLGTPKYGHFLGAGKLYCGTLHHVDIGIPVDASECAFLPEEEDFGDILPTRSPDGHKGSYGYVAVLGGCQSYTGAIKLANLAASALRCGCGVVKLLCASSLLPSVAPYLLESTAVPLPDKDGELDFAPVELEKALSGTRALAVGMGWGNGKNNERILRWLMENYAGVLILDADALNCLGRMDADTRKELFAMRHGMGRVTILTPHPMELQRISSVPMEECNRDPISYCKAYAKENHVILLRKGSGTIVTDGDECWVVNRGCVGMATAGSGDVLSGILSGLAGYNAGSAKMVACGAFLAGLAGERAQEEMGEIGMIASDTVRYLALAIKQMQEK